jgi:hypothetical protein
MLRIVMFAVMFSMTSGISAMRSSVSMGPEKRPTRPPDGERR